MRLFVYDEIDRMEIKFGFDMARLWWRSKPTPDGTYYGGIRFALQSDSIFIRYHQEGYPKMKCEFCGHMTEDLDDDGYCEDCVIEIGINRAEAIHDLD